jgi:hypothetical protein
MYIHEVVLCSVSNQKTVVRKVTDAAASEFFTASFFSSPDLFSNSGHVGWCTASPDTILKLDTLVMIQTKFGFHWSSTFRGEDF